MGDITTVSALQVVSCEPLGEGRPVGASAARLERVQLADGRRLVLKHLPPGGDWLTRVSGRADLLEHLWTSGLLSRLEPVVDHTVLDLVPAEDHTVVVMRDASEELFPQFSRISRATSRRLLAGLAKLHDLGTQEPAQPLCSIGGRYGMFSPVRHAADDGPGANEHRDDMPGYWDLFAEHAGRDVAAAVADVHRDPDALGRRLAAFPSTLLHGDAKLDNLGLGATKLVAIDWGDLTGFGPREVDVAWYASQNSWRIGGAPDDVFADYEEVSGHLLDREAIDLACIGSLAQLGWGFIRIKTDPAYPPKIQAVFGALLDWWIARARLALERVGPP
jgi:hypothetical protein